MFASVSAGPWHTCALTEPEPDAAGGLLKCWGNDYDKPAQGVDRVRPDDLFRLVSAGGWTNFRPEQWDGDRYRSFHASRTCVLDPEGSIACEGNDVGNHSLRARTGQPGQRVRDPDDTSVVSLDRPGRPSRAAGPASDTGTLYYTAVSAGGDHACALISDGTMDCFGRNQEGQLGPPFFDPDPDSHGNNGRPVADDGFRWIEVAAGGSHTCATMEQIDGTDTRLRCWGYEQFFDSEGHGPHPTGDDAGIDPRNPVAGTSHYCWLHGHGNDTKVSCRGDDAFNAARWNNRKITSFD